jgi:predicted nuclease of predicted toxin-antitoxin system
MKFLLDESADARFLPYLRDRGHDVTRLGVQSPYALPDYAVLALAHAEERILVTNDRDFGELVFRLRHPHQGVILFRLGAYTPIQTKLQRLEYVLTHHRDRLSQFLVVTHERVRVRASQPADIE